MLLTLYNKFAIIKRLIGAKYIKIIEKTDLFSILIINHSLSGWVIIREIRFINETLFTDLIYHNHLKDFKFRNIYLRFVRHDIYILFLTLTPCTL